MSTINQVYPLVAGYSTDSFVPDTTLLGGEYESATFPLPSNTLFTQYEVALIDTTGTLKKWAAPAAGDELAAEPVDVGVVEVIGAHPPPGGLIVAEHLGEGDLVEEAGRTGHEEHQRDGGVTRSQNARTLNPASGRVDHINTRRPERPVRAADRRAARARL